MQTHTPGPWRLSQNFRGMPGVWPGQPGTNKPICMLAHDPNGPSSGLFEAWEENGRLIATAPDLLYTLKAVAKRIEEGSGAATWTEEEHSALEDLIARASGWKEMGCA